MGFWKNLLPWGTSPSRNPSLAPDRQAVVNGIPVTISYAVSGDDPAYVVDMLAIPVLANGIEVKSNDVAQIPLRLYFKTANNGRQRVNNKLAHRLTIEPNGYQSAAKFWKTVAMQATVGECFISTRGGELNILPYGRVVPTLTPDGLVYVVYGGEVVDGDPFVIKPGTPHTDVLAYNEVWHFYSSQDEYGYPLPLRSRFRRILGLGSSLYVYASNVYNRGGFMPGYLSTDQQVNEDQKARKAAGFKGAITSTAATPSVEISQGGQVNSWKIPVLDGGWKFTSLNLTPQEMMLLESKKDLQRDFCKIINVPPWKVGILEDYKYATVEAAQREYISSSLNPLLNQIESEINLKGIAEYERDFLYVEFDRDTFISLDAQTMAAIDNMGIQNGGMSRDEWRERRNLPHTGDNVYLMPVNATTTAFAIANEALKLEGLRIDNETKRAALEATGAKPTVLTVTPAETPPAAAAEALPAAASLVAASDAATAAPAADAAEEGSPLHSFATTHIGLPDPIAHALLTFAGGIAADDLAADGIETDPHVTVLYGIHSDDPAAVVALLADEPPPTLTLGDLTLFPAAPGADHEVLKADVLSDDLHRLHDKMVAALEATQTHPTYQPHATVAYLKAGTGEKYIGKFAATGSAVTARVLVFSTTTGTRTLIPFKDVPAISDGSEAPPAAPDFVGSLRSIQAKHLADLPASRMKNVDALSGLIRSITADVAGLHGLSDELDGFAGRYIAAAADRLASVEEPDVSYEVNRAVNAANHEALRLIHGIRANVRWVGGENDGKTQGIMTAWTGTFRHPPINGGEHDCFLMLAS
jgi:phage portal protein BeeE